MFAAADGMVMLREKAKDGFVEDPSMEVADDDDGTSARYGCIAGGIVSVKMAGKAPADEDVLVTPMLASRFAKKSEPLPRERVRMSKGCNTGGVLPAFRGSKESEAFPGTTLTEVELGALVADAGELVVAADALVVAGAAVDPDDVGLTVLGADVMVEGAFVVV